MSHEGPQKFVPQEAVGGPQKEVALTKEASWQELDKWIDELRSASGFSKEKLPDGREKIRSPEGEEFFIRRITDPKQAGVVRRFLQKSGGFSEDEVDTAETIRFAIAGENYGYHSVEDAKGKMIALSNVCFLKVEGEEGAPKGGVKEAILFGAYIVVDPAFNKKGLGRELFQTRYRYALEMAKRKGLLFKGYIAEAVDSAEPFLNKIGSKRLYFESQDGDFYEVPFAQVPLDWDKKTGKPQSRGVPEHLMLRLADGRQATSAEDLILMVRTVYYDCIPPDEFFKSKEAVDACSEKADEYLERLKEKLSQAKGGKLVFMGAAEREQKMRELQARGKNLYEHKKRKVKLSAVE